MWGFLRRFFPAVRLAQPRTVSKHGAITETRTNLAVHFHFASAPPRAPKPPAKPKGDRPTPIKDWFLGPKPKPLTTAQVRALPLVRQPEAPPDPVAVVRTLTGQAFPTRADVARARAAQADAVAIAARAAQLAQPAAAAPKRKAPARKKAVEVEAHTRNGKPVEAHTRKKPGTATAARMTK
jgi:hypothetical protein